MIKFCFIILFLVSSATAFAGDTLRIRSVEINAKPNYLSTKQEKIDSLTQLSLIFTSLDNALMQVSGMTIKSYGAGMLSSPSLRGGSAQQTAVFWHGLNIQNNMLGQVDLSSIPVSFFANAVVDYTSQSNAGMNATSGSIVLKDNIESKNAIEIGSSVNSLKSINNLLKVVAVRKSVRSSLKIFHQQSENYYQYRNYTKPENPIETMKQAQQKMLVLMQENKLLLNAKSTIETALWITHRERNLPPTILENKPSARQNDVSVKAIIENKNQLKSSLLNVRIAYLNDVLNYTDTGIIGKNKWFGLVGESDWKKKITNKKEVHVFYNISSIKGISTSYSAANKPQTRQSASMNYFYFGEKNLTTVINASFIQINFKHVAPQLKVQIDKSFFILSNYQFGLKAAVYNAYRYPTLNDLFWNPGGNKNLEPEKSVCQEATMSVSKRKFIVDISVFNKQVKDWIIWLPTNGYWSPENIANVWSRGMECSGNVSKTIQKINFNVKLLYSYVLSTTQKTSGTNTATLFKQLIYVPLHKANAQATISYKKGFITYSHLYTGYRFTSADNKQFLNPYFVSNVQLGYGFSIGKTNLQSTLNINNIFNTEYESIAYRPMPLRYIEFGINCKI